MRRTIVCGMLLLTVAAATLIGPRTSLSAEKVSSDRLMPQNVLAYLSIPNIPELKQRWKQTLLGQLGQEESLAEFWRDVEEQWKQISDQVEEKVGLSCDELLAIPDGELALAVVQPNFGPLAYLALLDFGQNEENVRKLLEKADKVLQDQGARSEIQEIERTQVTVYAFEGDEPNGDDPAQTRKDEKRQVAYFLKDSLVVIASEVSVLEEVLQRWDGQHSEVFAEHPAYSYIVKRCKNDGNPQLVWFVDPLGLVTSVANAFAQGSFEISMALNFLPMLGFDNVKAMGGTAEMATEEFDSLSRSVLYVEFPTTGLLNAFRFPEIEQSPPDWIGADATAYYGFNWDAVGAYDAVEQLVDSIQQQPGFFAQKVDQIATDENGPKVHIKKDVVNQLTGRIHAATDSAEQDGEEPGRVLVGLEVKDSGKMQQVLSSVAGVEGLPVEAREFRGQTIYEVNFGAFGGRSEPIAVGVTNGHLMVASDVRQLEELIRGDRDRQTLRESADYQKVAALMPAKTSMLGFQQQDAQVKSFYELLRSGVAGAMVPGIDFTTLPEFEAIEKYLPPTGSYSVPDEHGVLFVSFSPKGGN